MGKFVTIQPGTILNNRLNVIAFYADIRYRTVLTKNQMSDKYEIWDLDENGNLFDPQIFVEFDEAIDAYMRRTDPSKFVEKDS